jgi:hypothetical protein
MKFFLNQPLASKHIAVPVTTDDTPRFLKVELIDRRERRLRWLSCSTERISDFAGLDLVLVRGAIVPPTVHAGVAGGATFSRLEHGTHLRPELLVFALGWALS